MGQRLERLRDKLKRQDWMAVTIELLIVILGITIAYQLNNYQQRSEANEAQETLKEKLRLENDQNLASFNEISELAERTPKSLGLYVQYLDSLSANRPIAMDGNPSAERRYFQRAVSSFSYAIKDQHLNAYLATSPDIRESELAAELLSLESNFGDLRQVRALLLDYRINYIWEYTDRGYDRDEGIIDSEVMTDNIIRNRLFKLSNIESEHLYLFSLAVRQMERVDSLLVKD
ncbi:hypothetical protein [Pricia sp.]|uniref:hypothetical protein n=1 Tax=Pricia sp. TaxID=2268138 RepID=UPI00359465DF